MGGKRELRERERGVRKYEKWKGKMKNVHTDKKNRWHQNCLNFLWFCHVVWFSSRGAAKIPNLIKQIKNACASDTNVQTDKVFFFKKKNFFLWPNSFEMSKTSRPEPRFWTKVLKSLGWKMIIVDTKKSKIDKISKIENQTWKIIAFFSMVSTFFLQK